MFITLEGIDGSGKSTQAEALYEYLSSVKGSSNIVWTREPGGWERGDLVRELLLNGSLEHPLSELYLFMIDRCEHVSRIINPAIKEGKVILCERYTDSTLAYQVWGRDISFDRVTALFKWSDFPVPDLTLWLDMDPEKACDRILCRGRNDRIELGGVPFMRKVRNGYKELLRMFPERIKKINAEESKQNVTASIIATIDSLTL